MFLDMCCGIVTYILALYSSVVSKKDISNVLFRLIVHIELQFHLNDESNITGNELSDNNNCDCN